MRRIFAALIRAYQVSKTQKQLFSLSDHMLRDIGLRRDQISSALLERVVLAEPRLAQAGAGGLAAEADRRREVPAA